MRFLKKGDIFYDIGAQAGYHSILAARCVGQTGRVFAFEALERNQRYMVRNFALNRLTNAEVVCAAVSDASGRGNFEPNPGFMAGHLSDSGSLIVNCITLDSWVESGHPPPTFLKIDAEGSELRVLHGAKMTLEHNLPVVFLDTHDFLGGACKGIHRECLEFLRRSGYNIVKSSRSSRFADRISAWP